MTDRYAVMGYPIAHSKSPFIHARFAEQTGEDVHYEAILVEPGHFDEAVQRFREQGGKGLNVTLPFKENAWRLAERTCARAETARAANTLFFDNNGRLVADNTDGVGLVRDLQHRHGVTLRGRRMLLLGAGGAGRGVAGVLLAESPSCLVIANRTEARAHELAARLSMLGAVSGAGFSALADGRFDVIVNATSASLAGDAMSLPPSAVAPGATCYDMMYSAEATPFLQWARSAGADRTVDGLGMLVEQAAESFYLWRGCRPATAAVLEALRRELAGDG